MIRIEKFERAFYSDLISWVNSEEQLMQFAGPSLTFPLTNEQLDKSLNDKNRLAFRVVNDETNRSIGHSEIYLADQSAFLERLLIADNEQRGKGLGQQIVNLLLDYIFSNLHKSKVELNVFNWNISAIKCYEKVGFVINPDKRNERKIKNEVWTAINMSIDKSRWQELKNNKENKN